jgi:mRNA-degrading endonuclease RelE of RelBE toxin-antitoxin system
MIYRRTARFKKAYQALPKPVRRKVIKAFTQFQEDPTYPSLGIKKIKGYEDIWEGRIDQQYRFTFHYETHPETDESICVFRNVDNHDECLKNP